jgi:hypothetical protein
MRGRKVGHDASAPNAGFMPDAQLGEDSSHIGHRLMFLKRRFGVAVEVFPVPQGCRCCTPRVLAELLRTHG